MPHETGPKRILVLASSTTWRGRHAILEAIRHRDEVAMVEARPGRRQPSLVDLVGEAPDETSPDDFDERQLRTRRMDSLLLELPGRSEERSRELATAARRVGAPVIGMVTRWNELGRADSLVVEPDVMLVWHRGQLKEARELHGIPSDRLIVTGCPTYDEWFDTDLEPRSRAAVCRELGVEPERPYALLLGPVADGAPQEDVRGPLSSRLTGSGAPDIQLVEYPGPSADSADGSAGLGESCSHPTAREALHHAAVAIGGPTPHLFDAVVQDVPTLVVTEGGTDPLKGPAPDLWRLLRSGAVHVVDSVADAVDPLRTLLAGHDDRQRSRLEAVREMIRPASPDVAPARLIAHAVGRTARGATAKQVRASQQHLEAASPGGGDAEDRPHQRGRERDPEGEHGSSESRQARPSEALQARIAAAANSDLYAHYLRVRDLVLGMLDEEGDYSYSDYWQQEVRGFQYMFDASPLVATEIREHCYHLTGLKSYEYRAHHERKSRPFRIKLDRLRELDEHDLFVPESPVAGGFGHDFPEGLVNLDTLKFYEFLIGLDKAGCLEPFRYSTRRRRVLEIGAGWGGFAYQFKTLFPRTTYVIVDLPATLLFSATYLRATFPRASMRIYGKTDPGALFENDAAADFIFLPSHALAGVEVPALDLAINMVSFQEMTTGQVKEYVDLVADAGCPALYSLNRDRSPYNEQLTSVTEIMEARFEVQPVDVLDLPYTVLTSRTGGKRELAPTDYRHRIGRLRLDDRN